MERTAAQLALEDWSSGTGIVGAPRISDEALEWAGSSFDPEDFDLDDVNAALTPMRRR